MDIWGNCLNISTPFGSVNRGISRAALITGDPQKQFPFSYTPLNFLWLTVRPFE